MKKYTLFLLLGLMSLSMVSAQDVTLEDLWLRYKYYPQSAGQFEWMADDHYYSTLEEGKIKQNNIEQKDDTEVILDLNTLSLPEGINVKTVTAYSFNADESKMLLTANSEAIYRHSSREQVLVYDRNSKKLSLLHTGEKIGNATFSHDSKKVAYTHNNNLFLENLSSGSQTQITADGKSNSVINGSTDWVYEEEFGFVKAYAWSADDRYIAYMRFDESEVKEFQMAMYNGLYPEQYKFKYPKAGEKNALVTVYIFDTQSGKKTKLDIGSETDQYIARMQWTPDGKLTLMRLNRLQNQIDILLIDSATGKSKVMMTEKSDTYLDVEVYYQASFDRLYFLKNSSDFLWASDRSGYNHLYRYSRDGQMKTQLTKGKYNVTDMVGVDEKNELIYFMSTKKSPMERHLYKVNLNGKKQKCMTDEEGTHSVSFSSDFNYYVDSYSNLKTPKVTNLKKADGKSLRTLIDNAGLKSRVAGLNITPPELFEVKTEGGQKLNAWMIKPTDFDASKKYPLLMFCYGGPSSQTVNNAWGAGRPFNYFWYQMLAQKGYIIVSVDNRGTGGRSRDFQKGTYAKLGEYETIDQIEAAKALRKLDYIDGARMGIWGWSFGGYLTSLCMVKGEGTFKCGIAVAPVINWKFYDTIYTERFLKTPQENPKGYDDNSPINFAKDLKGSYLLIHGTADDNVHFQNSMEWVNALVNANKQFDSFFYPNKNHGIFGGYTRYHLYKKMTTFLEENL